MAMIFVYLLVNSIKLKQKGFHV